MNPENWDWEGLYGKLYWGGVVLFLGSAAVLLVAAALVLAIAIWQAA